MQPNLRLLRGAAAACSLLFGAWSQAQTPGIDFAANHAVTDLGSVR